jgi:hypothetical protein
MTDPIPHPLVAGLVQQLLKRRVEGFDARRKWPLAAKLIGADAPAIAAVENQERAEEDLAAAQKLLKAARGQEQAEAEQALAAAEQALTAAQQGAQKPLKEAAVALDKLLSKEPSKLTDEERTELVTAADEVEVPELVVLAGYLGGTVDLELEGQDGTWRVLYIDSYLQNWRLVPNRDIVLFDSVKDDEAPFKRRDLIWVRANALTARGGAPPRPREQARFLRGDFTRAGDLTAPAGGGTESRATGIFCEAITPRCCTRPVRP